MKVTIDLYNVLYFLLIGGTVGVFLFILKITYKNIKYSLAYRKKLKELQKNKCESFHNWFQNKHLSDVIGVDRVCRDCGYVPNKDGFIETKQLKAAIDMIEAEDVFKDFEEKALEEISIAHNIGFNELESIKEDIAQIKVDFTIKRMDDLVKELRDK